MLSRQALWMPVMTHSPLYDKALAAFTKGNPISTSSLTLLGITPKTIYVALEETPAPKNLQLSNEYLSYKMAFPITIPSGATDFDPITGKRALSVGFITSLGDTCNSIHIVERLMPHPFPHVSVVMRTEQPRSSPGILEGAKVVVVSTVDKMGKRLVYCKTDVYVDTDDVSPEQKQREADIKRVADLDVALEKYEKVISATHIKSIIPNKKWG